MTYKQLKAEATELIEYHIKSHQDFPLNGHQDIANGCLMMWRSIAKTSTCYKEEDNERLRNLIFS